MSKVMTQPSTRRRKRRNPVDAGAPPSVERLQEALVLAAYIVDKHGPVYLPIMNRVERELIAAKQVERGVTRARQILDDYMMTSQNAETPLIPQQTPPK